MEIVGKIIAACNETSGVSQRTGNSWKAQDFVLETIEDHPQKCVFNVFGEDKLKEFNLHIGDVASVSVNFDAREYNGKWYNSIRAWRVINQSSPQAQPQRATTPQPQPKQQATQVSQDTSDDELPF